MQSQVHHPKIPPAIFKGLPGSIIAFHKLNKPNPHS